MPTATALSSKKCQSILDSARDAFAEHGYEGASMSAITRAAGVSKSTVYHHYRNKAQLFGASVEREYARMLAQHFEDRQVPQGDIGQTLKAIGIGMIKLTTSPTYLMIDRLLTSEAEAFPKLAQTFYLAVPQHAINQLACWLSEQTQAGYLAVQDAEFAADQFFALMQTSIYYRSRLRLGCVSPCQAKLVVDSAVDMFLKHYATKELK